jgi:hypothetical protein
MPTRRHNHDLWARLEAALASTGPEGSPVFEIQRDAEARIQLWREFIRAAEEESVRPGGDPRPRRFADAAAEAERARGALADALALRRRIEGWPPGAARGAGGRPGPAGRLTSG